MPIPDEVAALIGKPVTAPQIREIERGAIRRFAEAVDDPNPLYHDAEYARNSRYREMVAPVGFDGWPIKGPVEMDVLYGVMGMLAKAGYPVILDGGIEYSPFLRLRAGDILCGYTTIAGITEKSTTYGKKMLLTTLVTEYSNQNGEKALGVRRTVVSREL